MIYTVVITWIILNTTHAQSNSTYFEAVSVIPDITAIPTGIANTTTHVTITGNSHLSSLPDYAFSHLIDLTYADLSSNNLSVIQANAFENTQLETLVLYDNWLRHIPAIDHVASTLKVLNLGWNTIPSIPAGSLLIYPNLEELFISKNPIEWSSVNLVGLLDSTLKKLDLSETAGPPR